MKAFLRNDDWRQRGVALVTALLVVALATVAAVTMATRLQVDMRRTGNLLHGEQAWFYALAAESWAQVVLRRDAEDNKIDSFEDDWATALPPIAVEGGVVDGKVEDLQGRFNVNNLVDQAGAVDPQQLDYFKRLLGRLDLDPSLAPVLVDWIDKDMIATFPGGAEDEAYLLADPPYRAANRHMIDISELRLVEDYSAEVFAVLKPHVTALPAATMINVNTATAEVLLALDAALDPSAVESLIEAREKEPFADLNTFLAHDALAGLQLPTIIEVSSAWFRVSTDIIVGRGRARLQSLIQRDGQSTQVFSRTRARHRLLPPQS